MIALLRGVVDSRLDPYLIIDVSGVGYKVYASKTVLSKAAIGERMKVYTYTHVREDMLELYGFIDAEDLRLFEYLISVSGIGPKTAVGIFSVGERRDIMRAIVNGDVAFFTSVPRLGKKNAQKLIIELKSKLGSKEDFDINAEVGMDADEVVIALKSFGFSANEAYAALRSFDQEGLTVSEKVRMALKSLGNSK